MAGHEAELSGPDLRQGVPADDVAEGELLLGHADGEPVLLVRMDGEEFAVGASCTHHGVSLAERLLASGLLRCAAHHAAFHPRTGPPRPSRRSGFGASPSAATLRPWHSGADPAFAPGSGG